MDRIYTSPILNFIFPAGLVSIGCSCLLHPYSLFRDSVHINCTYYVACITANGMLPTEVVDCVIKFTLEINILYVKNK